MNLPDPGQIYNNMFVNAIERENEFIAKKDIFIHCTCMLCYHDVTYTWNSWRYRINHNIQKCLRCPHVKQ